MSEIVSDAQWQALQALPAARPMLLQYHWRWAGAVPDIPVAALCQSQGGRVRSRATVDLLAIGDSERRWSECWLIEFSDKEQIQQHIGSAAMQRLIGSAAEVEIQVISLPPPRVQRLLGLLNRCLRWLPAPHPGPAVPEAELAGGINPTARQYAAFQAADQDCRVHMFNLLRFHERARYADGDRGCCGRRAYADGYGRVALHCVLRLKGRIIALGRYRLTLVGAGGDPAVEAWDEIAVVEYPHRRAFTRMLSNPAYIRALEHRHAGLTETLVWSATPVQA